MSRRRRSVGLAVLVVCAVLVSDAASARSSVSAMACCAKTKGHCAGLKTPDDCCRGMGHVAAGPTGTTPQNQPTLDSPLMFVVGAAPIAADCSSTSASVVLSIDFKRLHDPPHLHTFALLI